MTLEEFNNINEINEISIVPEGWSEVVIRYGISKYGASNMLLFNWHIKNTNIILNSPLQQVYEDCKGDYEEHFIKILEIFRKDYISWKHQGFKQPWMDKYREQYGKYIYTY